MTTTAFQRQHLCTAISQPEILLRKCLSVRLFRDQAPGTITKARGHRLVPDSYSVLNNFSQLMCFPGSSDGKESACNAAELGSILGSGRYLGEGNGNPPHCSCLENITDRGAWQATVHGVAKTWITLLLPRKVYFFFFFCKAYFLYSLC